MITALKWLILTLSALIVAGFCVVNRHHLTLSFFPLPFEIEIPTYLLMLIMFTFGFVLAWVLSRLRMISQSHRLHRTKRSNDALKEEIARMKHQPVLPPSAKAH